MRPWIFASTYQPLSISIHAPIVGCDIIHVWQIRYHTYFNPRTHRGVRQESQWFWKQKWLISIHAPIVGCDWWCGSHEGHHQNFNPRTHRGVRPGWQRIEEIQWNFNPRTHRGVRLSYTSLNVMVLWYFNPRTHRGVRLKNYYNETCQVKFQSTHPSWGATGDRVIVFYTWNDISIHAPIVGCDFMWISDTSFWNISIHAPIVGCDPCSISLSMTSEHFNPRTHRGVRRLCSHSISERETIFQSTHPSWGATTGLGQKYYGMMISIHAPIVGCDPKSFCVVKIFCIYFNPRTHRGVRREFISSVCSLVLFQSTHPSWGATLSL